MRVVGDNRAVRTFRGAWSLAGLAAGAAGLATSYFVAMAMTLRESPGRRGGRPRHPAHPRLAGALPDRAWSASLDKPLLLLGIFVVLALVFAWAGRLARRTWWAPAIVYGALTVVGGRGGVPGSAARPAVDLVPVAVGFVTWLVALSLLTEPLRSAELARPRAPAPAAGTRDRRPARRRRPASSRTTPGARFVIRAGLIARRRRGARRRPGGWSAAAAATSRSRAGCSG